MSETRNSRREVLFAHAPLLLNFPLFLLLDPLRKLLKLSFKNLLQLSNFLVSLLALIQLLVMSFDKGHELIDVVGRLHYVANSFLRMQFILGEVRVENLAINHSFVD